MLRDNGRKTIIDASPTKDFFISILIRDIKLVDAIADLIDNCVDGARRLRSDGQYQGLHIDIEIDPDHFMISDNCGGITSKIAREYAFRFGRPEGVDNTPHSIGQFGVGMKRALFKMGNKFEIESTAGDSRFVLDIDVNKWRRDRRTDENGREIWEFEFKDLEEGLDNPPDRCGTIITVTELHQNISEEFALSTFISRVIDKIESVHQQAIENGLEIQVNHIILKYRFLTLYKSDRITPIYKNCNKRISDSTVTIRLYSGISDAKLSDAGWYLFCNDRLILRADKTGITGWDQEINGIRTPKPHYQFARFRGYIYFESEDASVLPWNTTKNGVDEESALFQWARLEMLSAMRPVIDFLNNLDNEMETESTRLKDMIESAKATRLNALASSDIFVYPKEDDTEMQRAPTNTRISYSVSADKAEAAKELLHARSNKEVGEKTFYFYLRSQGLE